MRNVDQSLPKSCRLLDAQSYSAVFNQTQYRVSSKHLLILATPNNLSFSRLGIIVAKKHIRKAYDRNRIKRLIRENFRLYRHDFDTIDMIVLARNGLDTLSNKDLHNQIQALFKQLNKKVSSPNQ